MGLRRVLDAVGRLEKSYENAKRKNGVEKIRDSGNR
jgi:hypothetical protein